MRRKTTEKRMGIATTPKLFLPTRQYGLPGVNLLVRLTLDLVETMMVEGIAIRRKARRSIRALSYTVFGGRKAPTSPAGGRDSEGVGRGLDGCRTVGFHRPRPKGPTPPEAP